MAVIVSVAEPMLAIRQGVVASSEGTITGTTGTWNAPGSAGVPFAGAMTDINAVNGDVSGIDAGDTLRLATAIENTGGGGAFDVSTSVTLPAGLQFAGGSLAASELSVYPGRRHATAGRRRLQRVRQRRLRSSTPATSRRCCRAAAGTAADTSGANLVVITYDTTVGASIPAASTLQTTATLTRYASVNNGTDFTPTDLTDTASEQVASPTVSVQYAGGSLDNADSSARAHDGQRSGHRRKHAIRHRRDAAGRQHAEPAPRRSDSGGPASRHEFQRRPRLSDHHDDGGQRRARREFQRHASASRASRRCRAQLGGDGAGARWTFTASNATADNVTGNNSFVIRVQLVASDVIGNQAGVTLANPGRIVFSDPDADTPNGTAPRWTARSRKAARRRPS